MNQPFCQCHSERSFWTAVLWEKVLNLKLMLKYTRSHSKSSTVTQQYLRPIDHSYSCWLLKNKAKINDDNSGILMKGWKMQLLVNVNLTLEPCLTGLATKHKTDDNATLSLEYRWICHSYPNHAKLTIWMCLNWTHYIRRFIFTGRLEHWGSTAGYPHVYPPCSNVWLITPLEKFQQKTLLSFTQHQLSLTPSAWQPKHFHPPLCLLNPSSF